RYHSVELGAYLSDILLVASFAVITNSILESLPGPQPSFEVRNQLDRAPHKGDPRSILGKAGIEGTGISSSPENASPTPAQFGPESGAEICEQDSRDRGHGVERHGVFSARESMP